MNWFKKNNIFNTPQRSPAARPLLTRVESAPPCVRRPPTKTQLNKTEQMHAACVKSIRRTSKSNISGAGHVPPEYGHRFETSYDTLESDVVRDLRLHFLSENERAAMLATLRFATNFVTGYINSKDMLTFNQMTQFKTKQDLEHVQESACTICGYKFKDNTRPWFLFVIVRQPPKTDDEDNGGVQDKPPNKPGSFEFACTDCSEKHNDPLNTHEIYPKINSLHVKRLFEAGFFYQFIFPLEFKLEHFTQKNIEIKQHKGPFKVLQQLLIDYKRPNETIMFISLKTTGDLVLKEVNYNVQLSRYRNVFKTPTSANDVNCFAINDPSSLMEAIADGRFDRINGTLFAEIYGYAIQEYVTGVITFPVRPAKAGYCAECKKTKMYYSNPVLNCSRCGFTNRYVFKGKYDELYFHPEAVKTHISNGEFIRYYDIKLHKNICRQHLEEDE
jgi:hypothetical protein